MNRKRRSAAALASSVLITCGGNCASLNAQSPAIWTLEPESWINVVSDGDRVSRVVAISVDRANNLYVLDAGRSELRVFDREGSLQESFGGKRAGADFDGVSGMGVSDDGAVWLVDGASHRYVSVRHGRTRIVPRAAAMWRVPWWGGVGRDGSFFDAVVLSGPAGDALLRIDTAGHVRDTILVPTPRLSVPRRGRLEFPLPFGARLLHAFDPRGFIWQATSDRFRILKLSWNGDTAAIITRPERGAPLTQQERDSLTRFVALLRSEMEVAVDSAHIARMRPLLQWLVVDDQGCLWVSVARSAASSELHVFSPSGRHIARVRSALKLRQGVLPVVRGNVLYAVAANPQGRIAVVRARIQDRR